MEKHKKLIAVAMVLMLIFIGASFTSHSNSRKRTMPVTQIGTTNSNSVSSEGSIRNNSDLHANAEAVSYEKWYFDWTREQCYTESGETFHLGGGVRTEGDEIVYMYAENIYKGYKIIAEVNQVDWETNIASFSMKNGCYQYVSGSDSIVITVEKL